MYNQDLLTIKQKDHPLQARKFVEKEIRLQRLIETYCQMCERAEAGGSTAKQKQTFQQFGQMLKDELMMNDAITDEDEQMINE